VLLPITAFTPVVTAAISVDRNCIVEVPVALPAIYVTASARLAKFEKPINAAGESVAAKGSPEISDVEPVPNTFITIVPDIWTILPILVYAPP
jgi:hypothetical protein